MPLTSFDLVRRPSGPLTNALSRGPFKMAGLCTLRPYKNNGVAKVVGRWCSGLVQPVLALKGFEAAPAAAGIHAVATPTFLQARFGVRQMHFSASHVSLFGAPLASRGIQELESGQL